MAAEWAGGACKAGGRRQGQEEDGWRESWQRQEGLGAEVCRGELKCHLPEAQRL